MPTLAAGRLRHRVLIQQPVETQDANSGAVEVTWEDVATIWCAIEPLSTREFIAAQAEANKVTAKIVVRYRQSLTPQMRLLHEATGVFYNIEGILADKDSGREYQTLAVSEGVKYQGDIPPS